MQPLDASDYSLGVSRNSLVRILSAQPRSVSPPFSWIILDLSPLSEGFCGVAESLQAVERDSTFPIYSKVSTQLLKNSRFAEILGGDFCARRVSGEKTATNRFAIGDKRKQFRMFVEDLTLCREALKKAT